MPDHSTAREEFTNIRVTRDGRGGSRWFTGPKEIINFKVISYFKQHLFRDAKGIYIYQTFRQFSEKGYITVEGPLLEVFRIDAGKITLDSLDELPLSEARVVLNTDDDALYVHYARLGCYAVVSNSVAPDFADHLKEADGDFHFQGSPVTREKITRWQT